MVDTGSSECLFCGIAARDVDAVVLHEDEGVVAFLDVAPIRPGHTQIVPRAHVQCFEDLPADLASRMLRIGQALAKRMKQVYRVERVAFVFTGGDVPHAHAHVVPMHAATDITSERYLVSDDRGEWRSDHLRVSLSELKGVRDAIGPSSEWLAQD